MTNPPDLKMPSSKGHGPEPWWREWPLALVVTGLEVAMVAFGFLWRSLLISWATLAIYYSNLSRARLRLVPAAQVFPVDKSSAINTMLHECFRRAGRFAAAGHKRIN